MRRTSIRGFAPVFLSALAVIGGAQAARSAWQRSALTLESQVVSARRVLVSNTGSYVLAGNLRQGQTLGAATMNVFSRSGTATGGFANPNLNGLEVTHVLRVPGSSDIIYVGIAMTTMGPRLAVVRAGSTFLAGWSALFSSSPSSTNEVIQQVVDAGDGALYIGGWGDVGAGYKPYVSRVNLSTGAVEWTQVMNQATGRPTPGIAVIDVLPGIVGLCYEDNSTLGFARIDKFGAVTNSPAYVKTGTTVKLHGYIGETEQNIVLITETGPGGIKNGVRALARTTSQDTWATFPTNFEPDSKECEKLAEDGKGNYYVAGIGAPTNGRREVFLSKLSNTGAMRWTRTVPGTDGDLRSFGPVSPLLIDEFGEVYLGFVTTDRKATLVKYSLTGTSRFGQVFQLGIGDDPFEYLSDGDDPFGCFAMDMHAPSGDIAFLIAQGATGPRFASIQQAPTAIADGFNCRANQSFLTPRAVTKNDRFAGGATLSLVGTPANGTAQLLGNGQIRYTPNPGFTGTDTVTYRATRAGLSPSTAVVTFNVAP